MKSYYEKLNHRDRVEHAKYWRQSKRIGEILQGQLAPAGVKEYIAIKKAGEALAGKRGVK